MRLMERYSIQEAQDHLQQLIEAAQHGATVLILGENEQAVQLVPIAATRSRKAGSARHQIKIATDSDAPLADFPR
jgi:antitoxin (DNA-binding transcriptional repressor) of toxin-antitoxin stability system